MTAKKPLARLDTLVKPSLGPLERQVLQIVCQGGDITVRDTLRALGREAAYTTIMTTLDRLHRKGILNRRKKNRAYVYSSALSLSDLETQMARDLLVELLRCNVRSRDELATLMVSTIAMHDAPLLEVISARIEQAYSGSDMQMDSAVEYRELE